MCVHFRYGLSAVLLEAFLGSRLWPLLYLSQCSIRVTPSGYAIRICLDDPTSLAPALPALVGLAVSVTPSPTARYGNVYPLSIGYASRPRLRSRLTQSGRTFLWKPWVFGAWDSHPRAATHTGILSSTRSRCPFDHPSSLSGTLPYHLLS